MKLFDKDFLFLNIYYFWCIKHFVSMYHIWRLEALTRLNKKKMGK